MRESGNPQQEPINKLRVVLLIVCGQHLYKLCARRVQVPVLLHRHSLKVIGWGQVRGFVHKLYSVFTTVIPHVNDNFNSSGRQFIPLFHTTNNNDYELNKGITI